MTDPVTMGGLAATVLSIAAGEALKTAVGETVKDAYGKLKSKIATWAYADVEALENDPKSEGLQLIVAETVNRQSASDLAEVRTLALALNDALRDAAKSAAIGVDIGRLEAARVLLQEINAFEGVGFRADEVKTQGDFTIGKIDAGKSER